jgi:hypothetical protein
VKNPDQTARTANHGSGIRALGHVAAQAPTTVISVCRERGVGEADGLTLLPLWPAEKSSQPWKKRWKEPAVSPEIFAWLAQLYPTNAWKTKFSISRGWTGDLKGFPDRERIQWGSFAHVHELATR